MLGPRQLLMLGSNETRPHDLFISLQCPDGSQVSPVVTDVTNQGRIASIFTLHRPQVVFHVAVYQHVAVMKHYPGEAMRVNVRCTAIFSDRPPQALPDPVPG